MLTELHSEYNIKKKTNRINLKTKQTTDEIQGTKLTHKKSDYRIRISKSPFTNDKQLLNKGIPV